MAQDTWTVEPAHEIGTNEGIFTMRVFVTGATRNFGSALVPELLEAGHQQYAAGRDAPCFARASSRDRSDGSYVTG